MSVFFNFFQIFGKFCKVKQIIFLQYIYDLSWGSQAKNPEVYARGKDDTTFFCFLRGVACKIVEIFFLVNNLFGWLSDIASSFFCKGTRVRWGQLTFGGGKRRRTLEFTDTFLDDNDNVKEKKGSRKKRNETGE